MNNEYDIMKAFRRTEETLIKSMKRNLTRHLNEEKDLDMNWSAWQAEQLKSLEHFKRNNKKLFKNDFFTINNEVEAFIKKAYEDGRLKQEKVILEAIKNRNFKSSNKQIDKMWHIYKTTKSQRIKKKQLARIYKQVNQAESTFFKINDRKLKALISETKENFKKAEVSILRFTDDQYRKMIYDAQVYANTGSGTVRQAVDMATKDFLSKGINSIEYANGAMVNIASYAEMAIRTANKRAYLQGEGAKRQEWGIHTILVPNRGGGCPYCIKFQGKVFIDDVWSGGTEEESKETGFSLLSSAIKKRLFHPNCKDTTVTYFHGISQEQIPPTKEELQQKIENYKKEQKLKYIDRNIQKYKRLELGSIDKDNIEKYHNKRIEWQEYKKKFKEDNKRTFNDVTNKKRDDIINASKVNKEVKEDVQFIGKLDLNNIGSYKKKAITDEVVLTDERLNEHILIKHSKEYEQLKPYLKDIVENPDIILNDNRNKDTIILLKKVNDIEKNGRVVIKIAVAENKKHPKNSIITLMKLNDRTWKQTLKNRGDIIFEKRLDKNE